MAIIKSPYPDQISTHTKDEISTETDRNNQHQIELQQEYRLKTVRKNDVCRPRLINQFNLLVSEKAFFMAVVSNKHQLTVAKTAFQRFPGHE